MTNESSRYTFRLPKDYEEKLDECVGKLYTTRAVLVRQIIANALMETEDRQKRFLTAPLTPLYQGKLGKIMAVSLPQEIKARLQTLTAEKSSLTASMVVRNMVQLWLNEHGTTSGSVNGYSYQET